MLLGICLCIILGHRHLKKCSKLKKNQASTSLYLHVNQKTPLQKLPEAVHKELSEVGLDGFLTRMNGREIPMTWLTMPTNVPKLKIYVHLTFSTGIWSSCFGFHGDSNELVRLQPTEVGKDIYRFPSNNFKNQVFDGWPQCSPADWLWRAGINYH